MKQFLFTLSLVTSIMLSACDGNAVKRLESGDLKALEFSNPLDMMGAVVPVATGFISTEGPVWHETSGRMFFSDIPGDKIYALDVNTNDLSVFKSPGNIPNGLALEFGAKLLVAEQKTRLIASIDIESGERTPRIEHYKDAAGKHKYNSPNDMTVHPNGTIYFTDPPFGLRGRESQRELRYNGAFLRKTDGSVELFKAFAIGTNPNGIILNPDNTILYLAVSNDVSGPILAFDVAPDGKLSNEREFGRGQNNDGMAIDVDGNLYVANRTGVKVFSKSGVDLGMIKLPDGIRTTNCAFGGDDLKTLYITNRSKDLYAVELQISGHR